MELNEETIKALRLACTFKGDRYVDGYKQVPIPQQLALLAGIVVTALLVWLFK